MILNFYVDNVDIYCLINEYGVKIIRDDKNNIKVSFSIKIPTRFERVFLSKNASPCHSLNPSSFS